MTPQISVLYHDESYKSVAVEGKGLITPRQYGMRPNPGSYHTGYPCGFYSEYEITNNSLLHKSVLIEKYFITSNIPNNGTEKNRLKHSR